MQFNKTILFGKKVNSFLLALITGILLGFSWPPIPLGPVLFVSFIPLFFVLDGCKSLKQVLFYSFIAFFIWTLSTMYWIANILIKEPKENITYLAFILIPLIMTLPLLVWKLCERYLNRYVFWLSLPFFWTAYEFLSGTGDLAFNWLDLGLGLSPFLRLIGFYQYTGIYGGTFAIILVNVLLFVGLKNKDDKKIRNRICTGLCAILVSILLLDVIPNTGTSSADRVRVMAVQSNTDPYLPLNKHSLSAQFDTLKNMVLPLKNQHPDLVVCSEGYFRTSVRPILLNNIENDTLIKQIKWLSAQMNAPILTGMIVQKVYYAPKQPTPTATKIKDGMYYDSYNAALLIAHDANTQVYTKNKLVPFVERTPFLNWFSFLERFHFSLNQMKASYGRIADPYLFIYGNMRIDPVICLEATFSDYVSGFVRKGANIIVVVSDDGLTGNTSEYIQAADCVLPLAIEMQKPLIRCANTGVSMIVQQGAVSQLAKWHEKKVLIGDVALSKSYSFYVKYGNTVGLISILIGIGVLIYAAIIYSFKKIVKK